MRLLRTLFGADEIANSTFKRTENGWIFATPIFRKLIGLEAAYKVDEAKKAALVTLYNRMWYISMGAVLVLVMAALFAQDTVFALGPTKQFFMSIALGLAIGLPIWGWYGLKLRPLLADATPASEPVTQADQYRAMADNISYTKLYTFLALFLIFIVGLLARGEWDTMSIAGLLLFGGGAVQYTYMLVRKIRAEQTDGTRA